MSSFEQMLRQAQSGNYQTTKTTAYPGLAIDKPEFDWRASPLFDENVYTFYRDNWSGGRNYGLNPMTGMWYEKTVGTDPSRPESQWREVGPGGFSMDPNNPGDFFRDLGFSLGGKSGYDLYQNNKLLYQWPGQTQPDPNPSNPYNPEPIDFNNQIEEIKRQYEEQLRKMQEEAARREREAREAAERAAAEREARIGDRRSALEESGFWGLVRDMYGDNQEDLNSYLDSGVFTRRDALEDWTGSQLAPLSDDLQKQYADALTTIQQRSANSGFGDASWMKSLEGALRQQQRALADLYGQSYSPYRLLEILSSSPEFIRGTTFHAPQPVSTYGRGLEGFAALDPTLAELVPGGLDENAMPWISTEYRKKNPWSSLFNSDDEQEGSSISPTQGFLRALLSGRR